MPSYGSDEKGLAIDGVRKNGPAEKAGIKKGDVIVSIKGEEINNIYDYMYRLEKLEGWRNRSENNNYKRRREERSPNQLIFND